MPLFPKLPRREFRYTPVSYDPEVKGLRDRLDGRLRLRRPREVNRAPAAVLKWALLLAAALAVFQYLHGDPLGGWLKERVIITQEDLVVPVDSSGPRP